MIIKNPIKEEMMKNLVAVKIVAIACLIAAVTFVLPLTANAAL